MKNRLARAIGTVFGVGYLQPAPGTWGSLAALPLGWALHQLGGFPLLVAAIGAVFILGVGVTDVLIRGKDDHDPSEIVIDEVAGQLIALAPLSWSAGRMGLDITVLWPGWIAAFVLFRLFDIWKPGPVGWADRRGDAQGVMLDDVIAGALAALGVIGLAALWHGVMGL
jgi:phosphatidylglycerophosphatase A